MSGHNYTKRPGISQRIKNIMSLAKLENLDQQSNDQNVNIRKSDLPIIIEKSHQEQYSRSADMLPKSLENFVDTLYSKDYSMTSEIFERFCETQTTATSHHFNNLTNLIDTLKMSSTPNILPTGTCLSKMPVHNTTALDTELIDERNAGILFCKEIMPNDSPLFECTIEPESKNEPKPNTEFELTNKPESNTEPKPYTESELTIEPDSALKESNHVQYLTWLSPTKSDCDFDSDDSVKDKNYEPLEDDQRSTDSDEEVEPRKPKSTKKCTKKLQRRHSLAIMTSVINTLPIRKRRMTICTKLNIFDKNTTYVPSEKFRKTSNNLPPKRRKYNTSLEQRKLEKQRKKENEHEIKNGCDNKCIKKCSSIFSSDERQTVHKRYWNMTRAEMRLFVRSHYNVAIPKRKYTSEPKRNAKRCFTLPKADGSLASVCKIFFLTTLGFKKTNDKILSSCLDENNDIDKRGRHTKTPKFDRQVISKHVETFNPSAPHYRREHAPNRRYLPSEININFMYKDFITKHPDVNIGYELYRKHLKTMNVSFTRLGNEECELCETYNLHKRENETCKETTDNNCEACKQWSEHREKYTKARKLYDIHKKAPLSENDIYYSSDLEKIIMLPRLETFKSVIFCPRLTAYNQTFAPVGKITKQSKPLAAIWHDGIAGRKQTDIMSAYFHFFLRFRDVKKINIWMDNCTAQNKNWLFFSMIVDIVNSNLIATDQITFYYFEPGHTFMSCDQFHHQVELSMKKKAKIYDFADFEDAVAAANNGKVIVKALQPQEFMNYSNNISERRIQNANPRAYLKNMSEVSFMRSSFDLHYKTDLDAEAYICLKFLNDRFLKNPQSGLSFRTQPKGIEKERKMNMIKTLSPIIPKHKMVFWHNLPISQVENECNKKNKRVTK